MSTPNFHSGSQPTSQSVDPSRNDQISFRFVLKTVGLLVHERLPEGSFCSGSEQVAGREQSGVTREDGRDATGEGISGGRKDKWFNLPLPEPDLLRSTLSPYRAISTTYPLYLPSSQSTLPSSSSAPATSTPHSSQDPSGPSQDQPTTGIDSESSSFADIRSGGVGGGGSSKPSSGTGSNSGSGSEVRVRRPGEGGRAVREGVANDTSKATERHYLELPQPIASASTSAPIVGFANLPPLLIAFILDLSDVDLDDGNEGRDPQGKVLVCDERVSGVGARGDDEGNAGEVRRRRLDPRIWKGRRKSDEGKWREAGTDADRRGSKSTPGIVLERWTIRSLPPISTTLSTSTVQQPSRNAQVTPLQLATQIQPSASTAYKTGITHFQAMLPLLEGLPLSSALSRVGVGGGSNRTDDVRMGKHGLKVGMKIWVADGWEEDWFGEKDGLGVHERTDSSDGMLESAWQKLEEGLVGLKVPFSALDVDESSSPPTEGPGTDNTAKHVFQPILMPNALFSVTVETRTDIGGLQVIGRGVPKRMDVAPKIPRAEMDSAVRGLLEEDLHQEYFTPTLMRKRRSEEGNLATATSAQPIPRVQAGISATRPSTFGIPPTSLAATSAPVQNPSSVLDNAAGLGFGRRRSSLGLHSQVSVTASNASSGRSSPMPVQIGNEGRAIPTNASYQRPSSLLSHSGRSFTQLGQLSESRPRLQSLLTSPDLARQNIQIGATSGSFRGVGLPLSPTGSSVPRNFGTPPPGRSVSGAYSHSPTPPIPETPEGELGSGSGGPQSFKRYSSSFGQRQRQNSFLGSVGSTGEQGGSFGAGYGSLRRSGGRSSADGLATGGSSSGVPKPTLSQAETEEISDFLRSLDAMPPPPSIMAMSSVQPRLANRSTSSSMIPSRTPSIPPSPVPREPAPVTSSANAPRSGPGSTSSSVMLQRKPLTWSQVDDTLKRMASSYIGAGQPFAQPGSTSPASVTRTPSFGARNPILPNAPAVGILSGRLMGPSPPMGPSSLGYGQPGMIPSSISKDSLLNRATSSSVKSSSPLAGAPIYAASSIQPRASIEPRSQVSGDVQEPPHSAAPCTGTTSSSVVQEHSKSSSSPSEAEVSSVLAGPNAQPTQPIGRTSMQVDTEMNRALSLPGARPSLVSPMVAPKTLDDVVGIPSGSRRAGNDASLSRASGSGTLGRDYSISGDRDSDREAGLGGGRRQHRTPVLLRGGFSPAPSSSRDNSAGPVAYGGNGGGTGTGGVAISPRMVPLPGGSSPITYAGNLPEVAGYARSGMSVASPVGLTSSGLPFAIDMGMTGGVGASSPSMASPSLRTQRAMPVGLSSPGSTGGPIGIGSIGRSQSHSGSAGTSRPANPLFGMTTGSRVGASGGAYGAGAGQVGSEVSSDQRWRRRYDSVDAGGQEYGDKAGDQMTGIAHGLERARIYETSAHGQDRYQGRQEDRRFGQDDGRRDGRERDSDRQDSRGRTPDDGDDVLGQMEMSEHKGL